MGEHPRIGPSAELAGLFAAALERPIAERAEFVRLASGGDEGLRRQAESLLAAHERAGEFLSTPALFPATPELDLPGVPSRRGQRIGPYRLVEEIGAGGMGTVYLAARADGAFEQRVAVKLLHAGAAASELLRRFENERRILARLEHPHIARLLDGGAAADGTPYLVMEYVDGQPIDEYCRQRGLPVRERLELLRTVCAAVHHAHQNLVVHRDLKPGNVLIDRDGRAKLLDFGIAKVLAPDPTDPAADVTRTRGAALTPRYASPEQLRGEPVTTASDIYSLGVILYELLAGRSPYGDFHRPDRAVERAILELDALRPSEVLRRATDAPGPPRYAAGGGKTDPHRGDHRRLAREVAGDLDTIVLQCLRKEPGRRYASAERLGEDLWRHLAGLPVRARPDTFRYRTTKFVRRHRAPVAAGLLVLVTLIAAASVSTVLYLRADQARAEAERQRGTAEEINRFLGDILSSIDPQVARGRDIELLRAILDRAAGRVERELRDAPGMAASLQLTIGSAYRSLGLYDPAEKHLDASLAWRRHALGPDSPATAESALALARLRTGMGAYSAAESLAGQAVEIYRQRGSVDEAGLAASLSALATVHEAQALDDRAEAGHREALALARRAFAHDSLRQVPFLGNLAVFLSAHERRPEAEPLLLEAARILRRDPAANPVELATLEHNLATLWRRGGRLEEAILLYREALQRMHAILPADHPQIPVTLNNLASALEAAGRYGEAETNYREALARQRRILGSAHRDVGTTANNLAGLLRQMRRYDEAGALYREAIRIYRDALGAEHAWVSIAWNNLAHLLEARGDHRGAVAALDEARSIGLRHWPATHWRLQQGESLRGACLAATGHDVAAESLLTSSFALLQQALPPADPVLQLAAGRLDRFLETRGRGAEAGPVRAILTSPAR